MGEREVAGNLAESDEHNQSLEFLALEMQLF